MALCSIRSRSAVWVVATLACAIASAACVKVAPYERGKLAHPTMTADDTITSAIDDHVRAISEGGRGGFAGGGGGCGCN